MQISHSSVLDLGSLFVHFEAVQIGLLWRDTSGGSPLQDSNSADPLALLQWVPAPRIMSLQALILRTKLCEIKFMVMTRIAALDSR